MSGNWRGGVDFRETFAELMPNICGNPAGSFTQLDPKASKLPQAGFCWLGVAFAAAATLRLRSPRPTFSLRAFCAHCRHIHMVHHSSFLLASHHPYTKLSKAKLLRPPSRNFRRGQRYHQKVFPFIAQCKDLSDYILEVCGATRHAFCSSCNAPTYKWHKDAHWKCTCLLSSSRPSRVFSLKWMHFVSGSHTPQSSAPLRSCHFRHAAKASPALTKYKFLPRVEALVS